MQLIQKKLKPLLITTLQLHKLYVTITSNNVLYTLTNHSNNVILSYSSGAAGYKNHEKKNPTALNMTSFKLGTKILTKKINILQIIFKGLRRGRKDAIIGLLKSGINIKSILDATPIPHNGCKQQKQRRI